jgi:hypothetical protein
MNALSICLTGTIFERRAAREFFSQPAAWDYSFEAGQVPPYVLTQEEFKIKRDLLTKVHSCDNRLAEEREGVRKAKAKWCPDIYEQIYEPPAAPSQGDPQVEVYYHSLGLANIREARVSFTGILR